MQTVKTIQARQLGAWLKFETDPNHCREAGTLTNSGSADLVVPTGTLLTGGDTPAIYDEATPAAVTGIMIDSLTIQPGATVPIAWLARGPATINTNEVELPGDATKRATVVAALKALPGGLTLRDGIDV